MPMMKTHCCCFQDFLNQLTRINSCVLISKFRHCDKRLWEIWGPRISLRKLVNVICGKTVGMFCYSGMCKELWRTLSGRHDSNFYLEIHGPMAVSCCSRLRKKSSHCQGCSPPLWATSRALRHFGPGKQREKDSALATVGEHSPVPDIFLLKDGRNKEKNIPGLWSNSFCSQGPLSPSATGIICENAASFPTVCSRLLSFSTSLFALCCFVWELQPTTSSPKKVQSLLLGDRPFMVLFCSNLQRCPTQKLCGSRQLSNSLFRHFFMSLLNWSQRLNAFRQLCVSWKL